MENVYIMPQLHTLVWAIDKEYNMENKFNRKKVEKAVANLLEAMGQDIERPGLKETPRRVAGYWEELLEGEQYTNKEIAEKYNKSFEVGYSNSVVKKLKMYFHIVNII